MLLQLQSKLCHLRDADPHRLVFHGEEATEMGGWVCFICIHLTISVHPFCCISQSNCNIDLVLCMGYRLSNLQLVIFDCLTCFLDAILLLWFLLASCFPFFSCSLAQVDAGVYDQVGCIELRFLESWSLGKRLLYIFKKNIQRLNCSK
jgi:hypothetical protein